MERKLTQVIRMPSQNLLGHSKQDGDVQEPQVSVFQACHYLAHTEVEKMAEEVYK